MINRGFEDKGGIWGGVCIFTGTHSQKFTATMVFLSVVTRKAFIYFKKYTVQILFREDSLLF